MIVNIKFYVITIASIFLALGVGIFIGFNLDSQELYVEQQNSLIEEMTQRFDEIKQENIDLNNKLNDLQNNLNLYEKYTNTLFPMFAKDRLNGLNVAIIETSDDYIYSSLKNTLTSAGAAVTNITSIHSKVKDSASDQVLKDMIKKKLQFDSVDDKDMPGLVSQIIADNIATNKYDDIMKYLAYNGYIETYGNYSQAIDYVIIAGGSLDEDDNLSALIDIPVIRTIKKYQIPVIGVERSDVKISYIDSYKKEKISTVDNVEHVIGETSLILVMQGMDGNFGIKESASALMPSAN
ncbi:copper transporter [Calorimonas adulescens]|uniref:Copper transporter n=1 Tax=Calorimonas adulescens TaxID=2606906 RepID=A0A5D8QIV8_9THEO|nr:copper transporter [Calorimonas adulescens]TZE83433.1 copper transporter [Calorimonas adulescens]